MSLLRAPGRSATLGDSTTDLTHDPLSPPPPDVEGTVNDPVTFPTPNKAHGQYHWTFERLLSAALVPLVGATAVSSANPVLDGILCTAIVAHSHMVSHPSCSHEQC